jgi:membrane-bound metal-dependent hydrolase YbcI (DUF457 family)
MNVTKPLWGHDLSDRERQVVYMTGIAAGIFPDLDGLVLPIREHRTSPLHTSIFWLGLIAAIMVVAVIFRRRRAFLTSLAVVILMGTWLHLLLDAIFVGVRLFVPLSDEYFRFRGPISWRYDNWVVNYILHPVFLIEIYVFVLAAAVFQAKRSNSGGILISSTLLNRNRKLLAISGLVTLAYAVNWFLIYPITVVE